MKRMWLYQLLKNNYPSSNTAIMASNWLIIAGFLVFHKLRLGYEPCVSKFRYWCRVKNILHVVQYLLASKNIKIFSGKNRAFIKRIDIKLNPGIGFGYHNFSIVEPQGFSIAVVFEIANDKMLRKINTKHWQSQPLRYQ